MAVQQFRKEHLYRALSTDTKPTNPTYDLLYETDTGVWYAWNGTSWVDYAGDGTGASTGSGYTASVDAARPADTDDYTAGDVVGPTAAALEFENMGVAGRDTMITSVELTRNVAAIISGETSYTLHLYSVTPPSALADNAAFDIPAGDRASYLGEIAIGGVVDKGSTLRAEISNVNKQVKLASTSLFFYVVTNGAYTPASASTFNVKIHGIGL